MGEKWKNQKNSPGNRGLGKDMALSLSKKGIDVVLTYNSHKHEAEDVVAEIQKSGGEKPPLFSLMFPKSHHLIPSLGS
jgi:NAD(P)-dependent dehydrogenase (short-subunit alcohol dehydrogenase family)